MNKLKVYFKDLKLGELIFENGLYKFFANQLNIKKANAKAYPIFLYGVNKDFCSESLLSAFSDLLPEKDNVIKNMMIGIDENDDDFVKLCKLAAADVEHRDFYVKLS